MLLATVAIIFAVLVLLSMPIVFALAVAGIAGLWIGNYPMQQLASALVSGSQSWVLDRKSTRLNSSHERRSRMPSSA